jgi:hypothetical protein
MAKIRKRLAIAAARNHAARLVENMEVGLLDSLGFSDEEYKEMQAEMYRIAARIAATVNHEVLAELGTPAEREAAELASIMKDLNR